MFKLHICSPCRIHIRGNLVDSHSGCPAGFFLINADLEREWIAALCGNRRDMVLVGVGKGDDFHGCGKESLFHGTTNFGFF